MHIPLGGGRREAAGWGQGWWRIHVADVANSEVALRGPNGLEIRETQTTTMNHMGELFFFVHIHVITNTVGNWDAPWTPNTPPAQGPSDSEEAPDAFDAQ